MHCNELQCDAECEGGSIWGGDTSVLQCSDLIHRWSIVESLLIVDPSSYLSSNLLWMYVCLHLPILFCYSFFCEVFLLLLFEFMLFRAISLYVLRILKCQHWLWYSWCDRCGPYFTSHIYLHGFELHRPSCKGTKLPFYVIKATINQCDQICLKHTYITLKHTHITQNVHISMDLPWGTV